MRFLQLIRWKNLLILLLTQWFVFTFLTGGQCINTDYPLELVWVGLSTILIAAAGYLINDYFDVKIDIINKPDKMVVERYISRRWVLVWHSIFNLIGVLIGFKVSVYFGLLNIAVTVALWQYSIRYKKSFLVGNVCVALLMALSLLVVAFAQKAIMFDWLLFYTFFAFVTGLMREIVKDVEDMEGDAAYGCRTLPVVLGFYKTKVVLYYLIAVSLAILAAACAYLFYKQYIVLPIYLIIVTGLPVIYFYFSLKKAGSRKDFSRLSSMIKLIMLAGILSMALRIVFHSC